MNQQDSRAEKAMTSVPMTLGKRNSIRPPRPCHRSGLAIILTVIVVFIIVIVFLAMAIEYSRLLEMKERAQTASEASSLAAVQGLAQSTTAARLAGISTAAQNPGNNQSVIVTVTPDNQGDLVLGRWNSIDGLFEPNLLAPSAARTLVKFHKDHPNGAVDLFFAGLLGQGVDVSAFATAERRPDQPVPEQLRIQKPNGDGTLHVNGGELIMNGDCIIESGSPSSLRITNEGILRATQITLAGDLEVDRNDSIMGYLTYPQSTTPPSTFITPSLDGLVERVAREAIGDEIIRLEPGLYPQGLNAQNGDYRLKGGVYFFGKNGIFLSGTASMRSRDAIIVLDKNASFVIDGSQVVLQNSSPENQGLEPWQGISLCSRQATTDCAIRLTNGALLACSGRIICPKGDVLLNDSRLSSSGMHAGTLEIENDAKVTLGDDTPHPHTIRIVQ